MVLSIFPTLAHAITPLPYTTRTQGYTGFSTTVNGDIRMVGMAGAVIGLADTLTTSTENPGALGMTLNHSGLQLTGTSTKDSQVQPYENAMSRSSLGAGFTEYPWGFSMGYQTLRAEGQTYQVGPGYNLLTPDVRMREHWISVGRSFNGNRYSLGVSLIVGRAYETLDTAPGSPYGGQGAGDYGLNVAFGTMVQLPKRFLLGASFVPAKTYDISPRPSSLIGNFFQNISTPARAAVGVGWIPNEEFHAGFSLYGFGTESNSALLFDNKKRVGEEWALQPRLGATYVAFESRGLQVHVSAGTYIEMSRIRDELARWHATWGLELEPWIFNFGWGVDVARDYKNFIFSGSIDIGRLFRALKFIPKEPPRNYAGLLPHPFRYRDDGLPRPLMKHWAPLNQENPSPDVIDLGKELPGKIREGVENPENLMENLQDDFMESVRSVPEGITPPKPAPSPESEVAPKKSKPKPAKSKSRASQRRDSN